MPFVPDSREGISDHRKQVMEVTSAAAVSDEMDQHYAQETPLARGVNGKSSGIGIVVR